MRSLAVQLPVDAAIEMTPDDSPIVVFAPPANVKALPLVIVSVVVPSVTDHVVGIAETVKALVLGVSTTVVVE